MIRIINTIDYIYRFTRNFLIRNYKVNCRSAQLTYHREEFEFYCVVRDLNRELFRSPMFPSVLDCDLWVIELRLDEYVRLSPSAHSRLRRISG